MRRGGLVIPVIVLASTAAAIGGAVDGGGTALHAAGMSWFLLVCPGLATVPLLELEDTWTEVTLALATSIALGSLLATALLLAGLWSPTAIFGVLVWISATGAALQLLRGGARR